MGEAKRRLIAVGEILAVRPADAGMRIATGDREVLSRDAPGPAGGPYGGPRTDSAVPLRAMQLLAQEAVQSCYSAGLERRDGKIWAAWLDALEEGGEQLTVSRGMVDWLCAALDKAKLRPGLSQWREALAEYLRTLSLSQD